MSKRRMKDQMISVTEFKQWLSGVEDMQESGWIPNAEQWKKIRAKIALLSEQLEEEAPQQSWAPQQAAPHPVQPAYQQPVYQPYPPRREPQMTLGDELFIPSPTEQDSMLDNGQSLSNPGVTQFS